MGHIDIHSGSRRQQRYEADGLHLAEVARVLDHLNRYAPHANETTVVIRRGWAAGTSDGSVVSDLRIPFRDLGACSISPGKVDRDGTNHLDEYRRLFDHLLAEKELLIEATGVTE